MEKVDTNREEYSYQTMVGQNQCVTQATGQTHREAEDTTQSLVRKIEALEHTINALRCRMQELEVEVERLRRLHPKEHTTLDRDAAANLILGY